MIDLNESHEKYDLSMEVLAFIPPEPSGVKMEDIAKDLKHANQETVSQQIGTLKAMGVRITRINGDKCRIVSVDRRDWKKAKLMAEIYMDEVYA